MAERDEEASSSQGFKRAWAVSGDRGMWWAGSRGELERIAASVGRAVVAERLAAVKRAGIVEEARPLI